MAKITESNIEVGSGGTEFVPTTPRQAVGTGPAALASLVDTGLQGFKAYKKHTAQSEAKNLLEKFTGFERKASIIASEDELEEREEELEGSLDRQKAVPGSAAFEMGAQEREQITRARGELERKRDAVDQGLLSFEQYRRDAETLFYQQVAMTPGLKDELAGAMSEYLGIDPRGQTAAIEMEKRKAALKSGRDTLSTMRTSMQKLGLWDEFRTEDENFRLYSQSFKERARGMADSDLILKQLEVADKLSNAQQKQSATELNQSLTLAQPQAIASFSFFGQYNANNMSASDFVNLPEEVRLNWRAQIQQQRDQFASVGQRAKSRLGDHFDPAPHQAAIDARFELIDGLLSGTMKEEMVAQRLKLMADENSYAIEFEKNGILMDNEIARRFAAISDIIPGEVLSKDITASNISTQLLMGTNPDLMDGDPAKRDTALKTYQYDLQSIANAVPNIKDWNDSQVNDIGLIVSNISKHQPDELDHATRQQLFRVSSDKAFMDKLQQVSPRRHAMLSKNIVAHQEAHNEGIASKLNRAINAQSAKATPDNFYLKKEDDSWMLVPTAEAQEIPERPDVKGIGGARGPGAQKLGAARAAEQNVKALGAVTASMNNARGAQWNSLVRSRANAMSISEAEAARQISIDVGLSKEDVAPKTNVTPERPGFGDEFKKDNKRPTPLDINMEELTVEQLNALSDASQAAVEARNKAAQ